jgi:hypothetical protein
MLNDKDIFLHGYKHMMTERLLDPSYNEYTNESDILSKLKIMVGSSETITMESMLKDMMKVKSETRKWHGYLDKDGAKNRHIKALEPTVLTGSAWILPKDMVEMKRVPHQVEVWAEVFAKYYSSINNSYQLEYRHDLSLVELSAKYGKKKYRINMTAPQACLLLLFNQNKKLTIPQIQNLLQIKNSERIKAVLMTLLMKPIKGKTSSGLLHKIPVKGVRPLPLTNKDEFCVHPKFQSKLIKFKLKEPEYGHMKAPPPPARNFRLEAALVRVMKTEKIAEQKDLILKASVLVAKFYKPDVKEVKKTIEKLIRVRYMERIDDSTKLKYLA